MKITSLSKKISKYLLIFGGMGFFMILGLMEQAKAESLAGIPTNSPAATSSSTPTKSSTKTAANTSATTAASSTADTSTSTPSQPSEKTSDLGELSIDQLLNVTVTSAEQKEQKLSDVAAAMTVLNSDYIKRSGATNIPDLLRYVPGVEVGQANNSDTSVAIRGFGGIFSAKLLVLVDGRSIYDSVSAGVEWELQHMIMEDIDRVEVIRGPGATIWGANAVNGVINIITKDAADTQGGLISALYGTQEQGTGEFRYGFQPIKDLSIRIYGQFNNDGPNDALPGVQKYDGFQNELIGFRADYQATPDDHFRLSSEAYSDRAGDEVFVPFTAPPFTATDDRENTNFVYEHTFDVDNKLTIQSYYDRTFWGSDPPDQFKGATQNTGDIQIRHTLPISILPIKQELTYGAEYRVVDNTLVNTSFVSWAQPHRTDQTGSLFVQTDMHLIDNVLTLTMGTKYDHNDYTGNEVQPSGRLLWKINSKNSLWWSVSRAVREPATVNTVLVAPGAVAGNPNLQSEELVAYEMGYRVEPTDWLSLDVAAFYNDYHNLIQPFFVPGSPFPHYEQFQKAHTYGIEPSFTAQVQPWWKLIGSYSLLKFHEDDSAVPAGDTYLGPALDTQDPQNEFSLRSSFDLPNNIDIDIGGRYVDKIAAANGYFAIDARVAWRPTKNWEVSVVGENLLAGQHIENPNFLGNTTYVSPEVYGKVAFKF
jgi:iron complex outermembrane receptor protein